MTRGRRSRLERRNSQRHAFVEHKFRGPRRDDHVGMNLRCHNKQRRKDEGTNKTANSLPRTSQCMALEFRRAFWDRTLRVWGGGLYLIVEKLNGVDYLVCVLEWARTLSDSCRNPILRIDQRTRIGIASSAKRQHHVGVRNELSLLFAFGSGIELCMRARTDCLVALRRRADDRKLAIEAARTATRERYGTGGSGRRGREIPRRSTIVIHSRQGGVFPHSVSLPPT